MGALVIASAAVLLVNSAAGGRDPSVFNWNGRDYTLTFYNYHNAGQRNWLNEIRRHRMHS